MTIEPTSVVAHGQGINGRGEGHAREGAQPTQERALKGDGVVGRRIGGAGQRQGGRHRAVGGKPRCDARHFDEAANQEARADENDDGHGDFRVTSAARTRRRTTVRPTPRAPSAMAD